MFDILKLKAEQMAPEERMCCLSLDEMSITSKIEYDMQQKSLLGKVTLDGHSGIANHALVLTLGGVTTRWKQTVAYHYTGSSMNGTVLRDIVTKLITLADEIGLHVIAVTSDMGSSNRAM